eukprot:3755038-Pyramimonas_sp.AAC.1
MAMLSVFDAAASQHIMLATSIRNFPRGLIKLGPRALPRHNLILSSGDNTNNALQRGWGFIIAR